MVLRFRYSTVKWVSWCGSGISEEVANEKKTEIKSCMWKRTLFGLKIKLVREKCLDSHHLGRKNSIFSNYERSCWFIFQIWQLAYRVFEGFGGRGRCFSGIASTSEPSWRGNYKFDKALSRGFAEGRTASGHTKSLPPLSSTMLPGESNITTSGTLGYT